MRGFALRHAYKITTPKPTVTRLRLHFASGPYAKTVQFFGSSSLSFLSFAPWVIPAEFQAITAANAASQRTICTGQDLGLC